MKNGNPPILDLDFYPKKILWFRPGAYGDLLVSTPSLYEVHKKFPNSKIYIGGSRFWKDLVSGDFWNWIDGLYCLNNKQSGYLHRWKNGEWVRGNKELSFSEFITQFDCFIDNRIESIRFASVAFKKNIRARVGTCHWTSKYLYTHWSPWLGKDPIIHERDRVLRILEAPKRNLFPIGLTKKNRRLVRIEQSSNDNLFDKMNSIQTGWKQNTLLGYWNKLALPDLVKINSDIIRKYGLTEQKPYILVNPTASIRQKAWPSENFKKLISWLSKECSTKNLGVYVIGAPNEKEWLLECSEEKNILMAEKFSDLFHIVGFSNLLITNTSSMQYVSASTKTDTITLMGRTFPARWGPLGINDRCIYGGAPLKKYESIFEEDFEGYKQITVERVKEEIIKYFNSIKKG